MTRKRETMKFGPLPMVHNRPELNLQRKFKDSVWCSRLKECALGSSPFCAFPSSLFFLKKDKNENPVELPSCNLSAHAWLSFFKISLNYGRVGGKAAPLPAKQMSKDVNSFIPRESQ